MPDELQSFLSCPGAKGLLENFLREWKERRDGQSLIIGEGS